MPGPCFFLFPSLALSQWLACFSADIAAGLQWHTHLQVTGCVAQGNQRRCLTNRAAAAAAAGHSGAQIAVLKHAAIGARISVWWPLDEHWYR